MVLNIQKLKTVKHCSSERPLKLQSTYTTNIAKKQFSISHIKFFGSEKGQPEGKIASSLNIQLSGSRSKRSARKRRVHLNI